MFLYDHETLQYTELVRDGSEPVWLPDGRQVIYRAGANRELRAVDLRTRDVRSVFALNRETLVGSEISADGTEIFVMIMNTQADIVMARLSAGR
ncbi:MAG: hypothetical protein ACT4QD_03960 [Acidobacteriota bacterium]